VAARDAAQTTTSDVPAQHREWLLTFLRMVLALKDDQ